MSLARPTHIRFWILQTEAAWLKVTSGGNATLGEAVGNFQTVKGSIQYAANLPTFSSCGTSTPAASAGSSSNGGQFTLGTGSPTSCTVAFATAFTNYAYRVVTPASNYTGTYYISAQSKTGFAVTLGSGTSSVVFNYGVTGD